MLSRGKALIALALNNQDRLQTGTQISEDIKKSANKQKEDKENKESTINEDVKVQLSDLVEEVCKNVDLLQQTEAGNEKIIHQTLHLGDCDIPFDNVGNSLEHFGGESDYKDLSLIVIDNDINTVLGNNNYRKCDGNKQIIIEENENGVVKYYVNDDNVLIEEIEDIRDAAIRLETQVENDEIENKMVENENKFTIQDASDIPNKNQAVVIEENENGIVQFYVTDNGNMIVEEIPNNTLDCTNEEAENEIVHSNDSDENLIDQENDEENYNTEELKGRPKRGRKRKYENQSRNDRKRKCNLNEEYINSKGNTITPKQFPENFHCQCKKKCTENVNIATRKRLFNQFWSMGNYSGRCALINMCVKEIPKKRCYTKNKDSKRKNTRKYFLDEVEVCKTTFLTTLQINQRRIDIALNKREKEKIEDLRGKSSGGHNKTDDGKIKKVTDHINSFPRYYSHYCRRDTESKYLHSHLNTKKMYNLYIDSMKEDEAPVSFSTYKNVFYTKFNLRFQKPKKDTCYKCDRYQALIKNVEGEAFEKLKSEHDEHLDKAQRLRDQMNNDIKTAEENDEVETLTFDLQKTHPIPKLPTGIIYYKRQLNLYNLGIHVGSTGKGIFNVWLEHEAGRGTQEVGSCLTMYLLKHLKPGVKRLILWSDSCGGQNRSINLVVMMMHLLQGHQTLETITLRFVLSGHSFLPNDSEFGDVERALKVQQRLYTDVDYINVMNECRSRNKFQVNRVKSEYMVSVQSLLKSITNRKIDSEKHKVSWLKTHEIRIVKNEPFKLFMKPDVKEETLSQEVDISKYSRTAKKDKQHGQRSQCSTLTSDLGRLWPTGKPLSKEKIKDLKEIVKLVPQDVKSFYGFLRVVQPGEFNDDVDGFGVNELDFEVEDPELE